MYVSSGWSALSRFSRRSGLGAPITGGAATADQIAATGAGATTSILVGLSVINPVVGAVVGGLVAIASQIASMFGGCGQTCVQASNIANQVEPVLKQNLQQYLAASPRYASLQKAALNNFDTAWAALVQACSNPQLQKAGQNCVADRQQGACHYKTSPGGWNGTTYTAPGANGSGSACWNWFVGYRDPIANDPNVVPDPVTAAASSISSEVSSIASSGTLFGLPISNLLIPAALVLVGIFLFAGDD